MLGAIDLRPNRSRRAELFFEFTRKSELQSLAGFNFSSRKLPHHRKRRSALALADQQLPTVLNQGRHDPNHRRCPRAPVARPCKPDVSPEKVAGRPPPTAVRACLEAHRELQPLSPSAQPAHLAMQHCVTRSPASNGSRPRSKQERSHPAERAQRPRP